MNRRTFLRSSGAAAAWTWAAMRRPEPAWVARARGPCQPFPFDPDAWLAERHQGKVAVRTPQSDLPLQGVQAETLAEWEEERRLYQRAWRALIGPWPARRPPLHARVLSTTRAEAWTRYKVSYGTLSGSPHASRIRAWLFVPNGPPMPHPAIVTLHQTVLQGKDEPAGIDTTLPWYAFATYYAERGYVTLAPDAVGYGERTRGCTEETGYELPDAMPILAPRPRMTLLGLMLFDCSRAVDYLVTRPEVDPARIGVMGHSQGGILTNCVLGLEPRFAVGVASCGYGIFRSDLYFGQRWAYSNSAYIPRMHLYRTNPNELPVDFLQIMALAAPRAHMIQTAMGDTIWTPPGVAPDPFVAGELRRVRTLYGGGAEDRFVSVEPNNGSPASDHGWYPEGQAAADALFEQVLTP